jgi:hypothetical protein
MTAAELMRSLARLAGFRGVQPTTTTLRAGAAARPSYEQGIEDAAGVADERRKAWREEAQSHINDAVVPATVPYGWLRFRIKSTEAAEIAEAIRALKTPKKEGT